ncbi:hypothetical protein [Okeania sp. SIO2C9]|uniref:hypothetical protein n=1 Tax=Okeania sp. SIO2C9 TaxID=2607791 RepID=UPI0025DCF0AD|nr:hypothetical protein [Okeania sp. SIO2C9]
MITKWIIISTLIIFGTFWLGYWTNAMTAIYDTEIFQALSNSLFIFDTKGIVIGGSIQILSLIFIFIISFVKPWGRRDIALRASHTALFALDEPHLHRQKSCRGDFLRNAPQTRIAPTVVYPNENRCKSEVRN